MKQIKTWQEAFEMKGMDINIMPDVSMLPEAYRKPQLALFKLHVVAEVLNDGWIPDYTEGQQNTKYEPWFEVIPSKDKPSGSGLSYYDFDHWYTHSNVGVRLCYKDRSTAEYAGTQFKELYEDLFLTN